VYLGGLIPILPISSMCSAWRYCAAAGHAYGRNAVGGTINVILARPPVFAAESTLTLAITGWCRLRITSAARSSRVLDASIAVDYPPQSLSRKHRATAMTSSMKRRLYELNAHAAILH